MDEEQDERPGGSEERRSEERQLELFGSGPERAPSGEDVIRTGMDALASGDPKGAVRAFEEAAEMARASLAAILIQLGRAHLESERPGEAEKALREAARVAPKNPQVHYALGIAEASRGLLDRAVRSFRMTTRIEPRFAPAYTTLAEILIMQGHARAAEDVVRRGLQRVPLFAPLWQLQGRLLLQGGKSAEAEKAFRRAIEKDAGLGSAWFWLGEALVGREDLEGAREAFEKAAELSPGDAETWQKLGGLRRRTGDAAGAVEAGRHAVRIDSMDGEAWLELGTSLHEAGESKQAVFALQQALEPGRELERTATTWWTLARCREELGDRDGALKALREACAIDPAAHDAATTLAGYLQNSGENQDAAEVLTDLAEHLVSRDSAEARRVAREAAALLVGAGGDVPVRLARLLVRLKDVRDAVEILRRSSGESAEEAETWYSLGIDLANGGDLDGAEEAYEEAIRLDPTHARAITNLGIVHQRRGELDRAIESWRRAREVDPAQAEAASNLGLAMVHKGDLDEAERLCREAARLDPRMETAWINLGEVLLAKEDYEGAIRAMRRARMAIPSAAGLWYILGTAHIEKDEPEAALRALRRSIELDDKNPQAWNNLGVVLEELEDLAGAIRAWEKSLALDSELAEARRNLDRVLDESGDDERLRPATSEAAIPDQASGERRSVVTLEMKGDSATVFVETRAGAQNRFWVRFSSGLGVEGLDEDERALFGGAWDSGPLDSLAAALEHALPNGAWILAHPRDVDPEFARRLGALFDDARAHRENAGETLPSGDVCRDWSRLALGKVPVEGAEAPPAPAPLPESVEEAVELLLTELDDETRAALADRGAALASGNGFGLADLVKSRLRLWRPGNPLVGPGRDPDGVARRILEELARRVRETGAP